MEEQERGEGNSVYTEGVLDIARRCQEGAVKCNHRPESVVICSSPSENNPDRGDAYVFIWLCRKHAEPIRHHLAQHAMGEFD